RIGDGRARGGAHCHGLDNLRAAAREQAHRRRAPASGARVRPRVLTSVIRHCEQQLDRHAPRGRYSCGAIARLRSAAPSVFGDWDRRCASPAGPSSAQETDLTWVKPGENVEISVDIYPGRTWTGKVKSIAPASGSEFSILPAQNSSGNWVKVVQRIRKLRNLTN